VNKSIRARLFMSITFLLAFFILLMWVLNNQYLEQYYMKKKKNILIDNAQHLYSIYKGNVQDIQLEFDKAASITGGNIDIRDSQGRVIYSSARRFGDEKKIRVDDIKKFTPPPGEPPMMDKLDEYTQGQYTFEIQRDAQMKIDFLALMTKLNNGDILGIRVPLLSIAESVDIANKFIIFSGLLILALGSAFAFLFSRRFTKPILELNDAAMSMAKFDFSKKCSATDKDEIGQLGQNINYLSSELDRAITELNIRNQKLEEDIKKERQIDEMRKEFISSVSHELRTPIAVIQGYAEGLTSNVVESEEDRKFYCDVIMNEANKMNKLVKDLLNLSQIESGFFQLEESEFELTSLIEFVVNKYKATFEEKKIELGLNLNEGLTAYGDMIRIEQVLTNYITNAINHIDYDKKVSIDTKVMDDKVRVSVFNAGKAIPEDELEKIWTSFYKVDKARTRAYGGYGLGLSIVRAIQELHENAYGVENAEGGVIFWFDVDKMQENYKGL
jgi:two-component system, OmpR family, sensor histidine kinase VanS